MVDDVMSIKYPGGRDMEPTSTDEALSALQGME